jgi:hypothetical protein
MQRPAQQQQHLPTQQQLDGTQLPSQGQVIQFRLVVAGQCREFEGTVAVLDKNLPVPTYKGKGQLLGYVAVQGVRPILPEDSKDKDAAVLRALDGSHKVVALCRKMPFAVRRAGAWRLV